MAKMEKKEIEMEVKTTFDKNTKKALEHAAFLDGEKKAFQSKKFRAFFFVECIIAALLAIALFTQSFGWPMTAFMSIGITGLCALAIGYILSQKALDKFMRGLKGINGYQNKD